MYGGLPVRLGLLWAGRAAAAAWGNRTLTPLWRVACGWRSCPQGRRLSQRPDDEREGRRGVGLIADTSLSSWWQRLEQITVDQTPKVTADRESKCTIADQNTEFDVSIQSGLGEVC
jgi:hypothetical protein